MAYRHRKKGRAKGGALQYRGLSCERKIAYQTEEEALSALQGIKASFNYTPSIYPLRYYKCLSCPWYHLGHAKKEWGFWRSERFDSENCAESEYHGGAAFAGEENEA